MNEAHALLTCLKRHLDSASEVEKEEAIWRKRFGGLMKKARVRAGKSAAEVADFMGVSPTLVCLLEKGERNWPVATAENYLRSLDHGVSKVS